MAANLGIPILKPEWLDFVWENRSLQGFEPTDQKILDEFSVKTFSGLYWHLWTFITKNWMRWWKKLQRMVSTQPDPTCCVSDFVFSLYRRDCCRTKWRKMYPYCRLFNRSCWIWLVDHSKFEWNTCCLFSVVLELYRTQWQCWRIQEWSSLSRQGETFTTLITLVVVDSPDSYLFFLLGSEEWHNNTKH